MLLPAAALAVLLLGFVVVYGSLVQSRVEIGSTRRGHEDADITTEIA